MYFPSKGASDLWFSAASFSPLPDRVTLHPACRNSVAIDNPIPRVLPVITTFFIIFLYYSGFSDLSITFLPGVNSG
jgi:hypothetical protein